MLNIREVTEIYAAIVLSIGWGTLLIFWAHGEHKS